MYDDDGNRIQITEAMIADARKNTPFKVLDQLASYLRATFNDLTGGGQMPDQHGICEDITLFESLLKGFQDLYFNCSICGRLVSPTEESFQACDEWTCKKCFEEGV